MTGTWLYRKRGFRVSKKNWERGHRDLKPVRVEREAARIHAEAERAVVAPLDSWQARLQGLGACIFTENTRAHVRLASRKLVGSYRKLSASSPAVPAASSTLKTFLSLLTVQVETMRDQVRLLQPQP